MSISVLAEPVRMSELASGVAPRSHVDVGRRQSATRPSARLSYQDRVRMTLKSAASCVSHVSRGRGSLPTALLPRDDALRPWRDEPPMHAVWLSRVPYRLLQPWPGSIWLLLCDRLYISFRQSSCSAVGRVSTVNAVNGLGRATRRARPAPRAPRPGGRIEVKRNALGRCTELCTTRTFLKRLADGSLHGCMDD